MLPVNKLNAVLDIPPNTFWWQGLSIIMIALTFLTIPTTLIMLESWNLGILWYNLPQQI